MATENNNTNKELYSRPAILSTILDEFGQKPISFLELLGDGTGLAYYATWLNIDNLIVVERDKKKYEFFYKKDYAHYRSMFSKGAFYNKDLNDYFATSCFIKGLNVINMDFCTFLYDNGKDNCTASCIDNMFKYKAIADGGLVFFTFQVTGIGVNLSKQAIKDRKEISSMIEVLAGKYGYITEEVLWYSYKSSKPTTMINYGIRVKRVGSKNESSGISRPEQSIP